MKLLPAQTKQKLFGVWGGGLSDLRMTYKYYFNIKKKKKQHKQFFLQHKRLRLFWQRFALGVGPTSQRCMKSVCQDVELSQNEMQRL